MRKQAIFVLLLLLSACDSSWEGNAKFQICMAAIKPADADAIKACNEVSYKEQHSIQSSKHGGA